MTEKRSPTFDLEAIKAAFSTVADLRATGSALRDAATRASEVMRLCR